MFCVPICEQTLIHCQHFFFLQRQLHLYTVKITVKLQGFALVEYRRVMSHSIHHRDNWFTQFQAPVNLQRQWLPTIQEPGSTHYLMPGASISCLEPSLSYNKSVQRKIGVKLFIHKNIAYLHNNETLYSKDTFIWDISSFPVKKKSILTVHMQNEVLRYNELR